MGKNTLIFLVAVLFILYSLFGNKFYFPWEKKIIKKEFKELIAQSNSGALSCQNSQKCLFVYIAPWCGACKQFLSKLFPHILPIIEKYHQKKMAGLEIIIGMDQKEKIEAMAKEYKMEVYHEDSSKKYQNMFHIKAVPTFIAVDSKGNIIKKQEGFGARGDTLEDVANNFLNDLLNL